MDGCSYVGVEAVEAYKQLWCSGSAAGVDEVHPEYLIALDVVGIGRVQLSVNLRFRRNVVFVLWWNFG